MWPRLRLYLFSDIYDHNNTDKLFTAAVKQNVRFHSRRSPEYAKILRRLEYEPDAGNDAVGLDEIPFLPTAFFKTRKLFTMPGWRLPVKATSSGTSGNKSFLGFNLLGLVYGALTTVRIIAAHRIFSGRLVNYLILGYEPHPSNQTVITRTQGISTLFALPKAKAYALRFRHGKYELDVAGMLAALERYAGQKHPVRLIGLPGYMLHLLNEMKRQGIVYRLPEHSMVLLGGGWKDHFREAVEKEELYRLITEVLGIREENCREFFGVAEHPALYCSCPNHHFHVSSYSRVIIRDPITLKKMDFGETGLVNLLSPLADSMPLTSVMTDDLGILHKGDTCGCGIRTPYLEIIGRVGVKQVQTCAARASALLKQKGVGQTDGD